VCDTSPPPYLASLVVTLTSIFKLDFNLEVTRKDLMGCDGGIEEVGARILVLSKE